MVLSMMPAGLPEASVLSAAAIPMAVRMLVTDAVLWTVTPNGEPAALVVRTSLKFSTLERAHICNGQLEPFAFRTSFGKPAVPVCFDTGRIVSSNCMFQCDFLRQGDANLFHAPLKLVAASDLVVTAGLER